MSVTLTPIAAARIKQRAGDAKLRASEAQLSAGDVKPCVRLGVRKTGCSGFSYVVEYVNEAATEDAVFQSCGVDIVVAPAHLAMVDGLCIDFRKNGIAEMFHFENPNATAVCGCGESFTVNEPG